MGPHQCLLPLMKTLGKLETGWGVLSCNSSGLPLQAMTLRCFPSLWDSFILYLGCIFYAVGEANWEINVILHCAKLDVFVYDGLFTREPIQKEL